MGIGSSIQARWKVLDLAYNWLEIRDKWPLTRDLDRRWCHCPWMHGLRPKKLYTRVKMTPAPVGVCIQRSLVPSFTLVVDSLGNFLDHLHICRLVCISVHVSWAECVFHEIWLDEWMVNDFICSLLDKETEH